MANAVVALPHGVSASSEQENEAPIPKLGDRLSEELVIATVGPVGSGCTSAANEIKRLLEADFGYEVHYYRLSDIIQESQSLVAAALAEVGRSGDKVGNLQTIGDLLRQTCGNSYLAAKAVEKIAFLRRQKGGVGQAESGALVPKTTRRAYLIDSLKHRDELKLLRDTYGDIFWLVGVFAPRSVREERLRVYEGMDPARINETISRDYQEDLDHGQQVREVFFQADLFLRNDQPNKAQLANSTKRFLEVLFGTSVHTPTNDESAMYAAYAEAAKSACLSRQVGAAIVTQEGELIAVGRNDVPKYGGGLYREDDLCNDHRCHNWQSNRCHNDRRKDLLYKQIFKKLKDSELLQAHVTEASVIDALKKTDAKALIEYSRAVHAEMDAITSVARTAKGSLLRGTIFTTTYPCHSCARHIVASGLTRVVYIEPYPKSLAGELHSDSVSEVEAEAGSKVVFLQYSGIAPKNVLKLFSYGMKRKGNDGSVPTWDKTTAKPVVRVSLDDYSVHEQLVIAELAQNESKAAIGRQATLFQP